MKKMYTILAALLLVVASCFSESVTYNFESGREDWVFLHYGQANYWVRGTDAGSASEGNYALYITHSNDKKYEYLENQRSVSWAYVSVTLTEESTISFSWKGEGEGDYDCLKVYLSPIIESPQAGSTTPPTGAVQLGGYYSGQPNWQNVTLSPGKSGNYNLFFMWANDGSVSSGDPAAIDHVCISTPSYYVLTAVADGNGTVTRTPNAESYKEGTSVTLTAVADAGYRFTRWSYGNKENPRTVVVNADMNLTAIFQDENLPLQYVLNVTAGVGGSVTKSPDKTLYDEGTVVTVTAVADEGYAFSQWSDGNTETTRKVTMDKDYVLQATFNTLQPTDITDFAIKTSELNMTVTWKSTAPNFEVLIKDKDDEKVSKLIAENTAKDENPNKFTYTVSKNGKYTVSVTPLDNAYQPVGASVSKEVTLKKTVYYTLVVLPSENGKASMPVGVEQYKSGEEVSLTPIADEGYVFDQWLVNGSVVADEKLVIMMDQDYEVKPTFKPENVAVDNVSVDAKATQKLLRNGRLVIVRDGKTYNAVGQEM